MADGEVTETTDKQTTHTEGNGLLRLNMGCGPVYASGWLNVDRNAGEYGITADVRQDIQSPVGEWVRRCSHIYAGHVLEHLEEEDVVDVLRLWQSYIVPGGQLLVVGPDCDRTKQCVRDGAVEADWLDAVLPSRKRGVGLDHLWYSTSVRTAELLSEAGYDSYDLIVDHNAPIPPPWPVLSHAAWQFARICVPRLPEPLDGDSI